MAKKPEETKQQIEASGNANIMPTDNTTPYTGKERIEFGADNNQNVKVTRGGQTFDLSPQEYQAYNKGYGQITEQVNKLRAIGEKERLKSYTDKRLREGATIGQVTEELLNSQIKNSGQQILNSTGVKAGTTEAINKTGSITNADGTTTTPQTDTTKTTTGNGVISSTTSEIKSYLDNPPQQMGLLQKDTGEPTAFKNALIASTLPMGAIADIGFSTAFNTSPSDISTGVSKWVAQSYDFYQSFTKEGKSISQIEAEKTFNKVESDLNQDLMLVANGFKNPSEVRKKITLAEQAIDRLEQATRGANKANLRYMLLDGKDVEAQLIINRQDLQDFKVRLLYAEQEFQNKQREEQLAQAKANYGL